MRVVMSTSINNFLKVMRHKKWLVKFVFFYLLYFTYLFIGTKQTPSAYCRSFMDTVDKKTKHGCYI
jgi:hypothetical protein